MTEQQIIEILKKKLQSMRYSKADVQDETSRDAKQFMYGYTECINDLLEYLIEGGDGLPEHSLALQGEKEDYGGIHNLKPAKNWDEDKDQENGNYMNKCIYCKSFFMGHKRRVVCKECSKGKPTKDIPLDMIEKWAYNTANKDDVTDFYDNTIYGKIIGAKAMQSGEIAKWAEENGQ